jgi:hypothetical protein
MYMELNMAKMIATALKANTKIGSSIDVHGILDLNYN